MMATLAMGRQNYGIKIVRLGAHIVRQNLSLICCVIFYNNDLSYFVYF